MRNDIRINPGSWHPDRRGVERRPVARDRGAPLEWRQTHSGLEAREEAVVIPCRCCETRPGHLAGGAFGPLCDGCGSKLGAYILTAPSEELSRIWRVTLVGRFLSPTHLRYRGPAFESGECDDGTSNTHAMLAAIWLAEGGTELALLHAGEALRGTPSSTTTQKALDIVFDARLFLPEGTPLLLAAVRQR